MKDRAVLAQEGFWETKKILTEKCDVCHCHISSSSLNTGLLPHFFSGPSSLCFDLMWSLCSWGIPSSRAQIPQLCLHVLFSVSTQSLDMVCQLFPGQVSPLLCPLILSTGIQQIEPMQSKSDIKSSKSYSKSYTVWGILWIKIFRAQKPMLSTTITGVFGAYCPTWLPKHRASRDNLP